MGTFEEKKPMGWNGRLKKETLASAKPRPFFWTMALCSFFLLGAMTVESQAACVTFSSINVTSDVSCGAVGDDVVVTIDWSGSWSNQRVYFDVGFADSTNGNDGNVYWYEQGSTRTGCQGSPVTVRGTPFNTGKTTNTASQSVTIAVPSVGFTINDIIVLSVNQGDGNTPNCDGSNCTKVTTIPFTTTCPTATPTPTPIPAGSCNSASAGSESAPITQGTGAGGGGHTYIYSTTSDTNAPPNTAGYKDITVTVPTCGQYKMTATIYSTGNNSWFVSILGVNNTVGNQWATFGNSTGSWITQDVNRDNGSTTSYWNLSPGTYTVRWNGRESNTYLDCFTMVYVASAACPNTPTNTPTPTPPPNTPTKTPTSTPSPTPTKTNTPLGGPPTNTFTPTNTYTPTVTNTPTKTNTPTITPTPTITKTPTPLPCNWPVGATPGVNMYGGPAGGAPCFCYSSAVSFLTDKAVFGMSLGDVKILADYTGTSLGSSPVTLDITSDWKLSYFSGPVTYGPGLNSPYDQLGNVRNKKGQFGVLVVDGDLTLMAPSGSTLPSYFGGIIFVTGNITVGAGCWLDGAVIMGKPYYHGTKGSVTMQGSAGNYGTITYNPGLIQKAQAKVGVYREDISQRKEILAIPNL